MDSGNMNELIGNPKNDFVKTVQDAGNLAGRDDFKRQSGSLARLHVPPEVIRALPAEFAKRHCLLPFAINHGTIHIATAAPGNQRVIDDIRLLSGLEVEEFEAPAAEIIEKIAALLSGDGRENDRKPQPGERRNQRREKSPGHRGDGQRAHGRQSGEFDHFHRVARTGERHPSGAVREHAAIALSRGRPVAGKTAAAEAASRRARVAHQNHGAT